MMRLTQRSIAGLLFVSLAAVVGYRGSFFAKASPPPPPVVLKFKSMHVQTPTFDDKNSNQTLTAMTDPAATQLLIANVRIASTTDPYGTYKKIERNGPISENISTTIELSQNSINNSVCVWRFSIEKNSVKMNSERCSYPQGQKADLYVDYVYR